MGSAAQRIGGVRADLARRIDAMDRRADHLRPGELAFELEYIRRAVSSNGFRPAIAVIQALDGALSRGERGPLVHGWLAILRDAVDCGRSDARTCDTYAAACSVRLGA